MHLLVLGAFRLQRSGRLSLACCCLNAPSGAWCFPTQLAGTPASYPTRSLNAPSGAWCFPTVPPVRFPTSGRGSQCTFWCLVLSDRSWGSPPFSLWPFQCTFWCLVLSDSTPRKQRHNAAYRSEIAADLESTTLDRLTPLQLNHTTAENRHKQPQRHRHPLPTSTPPASNKPKPKTTTSRLLIRNYFDDLL